MAVGVWWEELCEEKQVREALKEEISSEGNAERQRQHLFVAPRRHHDDLGCFGVQNMSPAQDGKVAERDGAHDCEQMA